MQNSGVSFRPADQESLKTTFFLDFFFLMELLINLFYVLSLSCDTKGVLAWLRFFFSSHFFLFLLLSLFLLPCFSPHSEITPDSIMRAFASCRGSVHVLRRPALFCTWVSPLTSLRSCSTASAAGSTSTHDDGSRRPANGFDQFRQQQQEYHRHSFYEKGSAPPRGSSASGNQQQPNEQQQDHSSSSSSSFTSTSERVKDERVYGHGSATAQQRRQMRQQWEKSFFGRVHFDDSMHSRFAEALASEEEEAFRQSIEGHTHAELFPRWPEDEEAPLAEFKRLRPSLQLRYIVNRLSMGERRIRYAVDYGGLSMMYQLNLGELMVNEAEKLLRELGWMNDDVAAKIEEVKMLADKIKYDFDLD